MCFFLMKESRDANRRKVEGNWWELKGGNLIMGLQGKGGCVVKVVAID